jgi:Mrp family chromosome partitioning ATPase
MTVVIPGVSRIAHRLRGSRRGVQGQAREGLLPTEGSAGAFAEAFRLLALSVRTLLQDRPLKALSVVSAHSGDGRSTVATNLAMALGQDAPTLLLSSFQRGTGQERGWFRESVLHARGPQRDGLLATLQECHLWGQGNGRAGPEDTLTRLLEETTAAGAYVVIDSPPALLSSDAFWLAQQTRAALYVVRTRPQDMQIHRRVQESLRRLDVEIIGLVVNEF